MRDMFGKLASLRNTIPFLRKATLPREDTLALHPVRNPVILWKPKEPAESAEEDSATDEDPLNAGVVLTVPRRAREDYLNRLLNRLFHTPSSKTIELDEFGGKIWSQCDGKHSVAELVSYTCTEYKLNRRQAEVSVIQFMKMLSQRRLVGFTSGGRGSAHGSSQPGPRSGKRRTSGASKRRH
jgi:Coenzyme PQQ synthesis protein D (PqqD)